MSLKYEKMVDLFKIKVQGDQALIKLNKIKGDFNEELIKKLNKTIKEANYAKSIILEENLLLVDFVISTRYSNVKIAYEDLQQEGRLGLIRAIETFDYKKGYKLSTYAHYWIRSYLNQAINNYRQLGVSGYNINRLKQISKYETEFQLLTGRLPSFKEINEHTGLSIKEINELKTLPTIISLDQPISLESNLTLKDIIEDKSILNADQLFNEELKLINLEKAIKTLTEVEQLVINLRYGLKGSIHTLKQTGNIVKLSIERVRKIQLEALNKLRIYYQKHEK